MQIATKDCALLNSDVNNALLDTHGHRVIHVSKIAFVASLACFVAGCAIIPAPVTSTSGSLSPEQPVRLIEDGATTALARDATAAVRQLLTVQGYRIDPKSNLGVEVGIARRDTDVAFSTPRGPAGSEATEGRSRSRPLSICDNRITRLTISIVELDVAKVVYRGVAEDVGCGEPSSNDLHILAAAAMKSLRRIG